MLLQFFAFGIKLFPAQAGVIPRAWTCFPPKDTVPRASGGDPNRFRDMCDTEYCSPRKRG